MSKSPKVENIPRKSVYRISLYHRCLSKLRENEIETVSSAALSKAAGVKPAQLRKDLAQFGQFGTRGLGYNVENLASVIVDVLGKTSLQPVILVGVGNLGTALLRHRGFNKEGFEFVAAFDTEPDRASRGNEEVQVHDYAEMMGFIEERGLKMAILSVPGLAAQAVTNDLVSAGIQAILNFSPAVLEVPEEVVVNNVDLALELENLSYFIR